MLPYMLNFLIGFQGPFRPLISINEYFDFILIVLLGLGVIFELPVLIFFLALFDIVTPKFLWKNLRYAILIIAVVAAIVTPTPDATTMLVFMAPMVALYFVGIGVAALVVAKKAKTGCHRRSRAQDRMKLRLRRLERGTMLFAALSFVCLAACGHSSPTERARRERAPPGGYVSTRARAGNDGRL